MALVSTQPLTEKSSRDISWGVKVAGAYGWQTYHFDVSIVLKSGDLYLLETSGPLQVLLYFTYNDTKFCILTTLCVYVCIITVNEKRNILGQ
jgi:hypothetical protein